MMKQQQSNKDTSSAEEVDRNNNNNSKKRRISLSPNKPKKSKTTDKSTKRSHHNDNNANDDTIDGSNRFQFDPSLLHTIAPHQFLGNDNDNNKNNHARHDNDDDDGNNDENGGDHSRRTRWELAWSRYMSALNKKYKGLLDTDRFYLDDENAMEPRDVNHCYAKWLPAFDDMRTRIARHVVHMIHLSKHEYTRYDIRVDQRQWSLVERLSDEMMDLLERNENRIVNDMKQTLFLQAKCTERQNRLKRESEQSEQQWRSLAQRSEEEQLEIFVLKFGPELGRSKFLEWNSSQQLQKTLGHMVKSWNPDATTGSAATVGAHDGVASSGGSTDYHSGMIKLDRALQRSERRLNATDERHGRTVHNTELSSRKKGDEGYDDLLDGSLL